MKNTAMNRRHFLENTGKSLGAATVGWNFGYLSFFAETARAAEVMPGADDVSLKSSTAILTTVARRLFPHDRLSDGPYRRVAEMAEAQAAGDPAFQSLLATGIAALNQSRAPDWQTLDAAAQTAVLRELAETPFVQAMRDLTFRLLYWNPEVWAHVGYEGPSALKGGYLNRGFDDIDWLPGAGSS